jgi:hypothetical protein
MTFHIAKTRVGFCVSFLLAAFLMPAPLSATPQSAGDTQQRAKVVAHLALPGMHVNQMFLQQRGDTFYLFLHRPIKQAFALVDVSRPDKPVLVERAVMKEGAGTEVEMMKSEATLAVSVSPERPAPAAGAPQPPAEPAEVKLPTETVRLIDLSDPKNPKVIKTFTGVTSMLPDDPRRLLFIVNNEGLWVVLHREEHFVPYCGSQSALMIQPNCQ